LSIFATANALHHFLSNFMIFAGQKADDSSKEKERRRKIALAPNDWLYETSALFP
jgi:hypothetical protein